MTPERDVGVSGTVTPRTLNAKVKALAERIRAGQKPEIEAMLQLLTTQIKEIATMRRLLKEL